MNENQVAQPDQDEVTTIVTGKKFGVTEVRVTYSRTMQLQQYEPFNPMTTVTVQVFDDGATDEAIRHAYGLARQGSMEEFARVKPALMAKMPVKFVDLWLEELDEKAKRHVLEWARQIDDDEGIDDDLLTNIFMPKTAEREAAD